MFQLRHHGVAHLNSYISLDTGHGVAHLKSCFSLDTGHGAVVAALRPAALLAFGTMGVDGTFGNRHLAGDQVADAVLPVGPFHLRA